MPKAYAYIRVSTEDQAESGLGMAAQIETCKRYYAYDLEPKGIEWGGEYADRAVSGARPMRSRPQGASLNALLEKGDVVLFAKLDRGFRDTEDLLATVRLWKERGVTCRFLDIGCDTATDFGMLMLTIGGAFATFERARITVRIREGMAQLRKRGLPLNQKVQYGYKITRRMGQGRRMERKVVPCEHSRKIGARIVVLRDEKNMTFEDIYYLFLRDGVRDRDGKEIGISRIRRAYDGELAFRAQEAQGSSPSDTASPPGG